VTVSVGVSVYPNDGTTIEKLFIAADRALYRMKRGEKKKFALGNVAAML
jgi:GGDEF domain-containing protein